MNALKDVETQKRGFVGVAYNVGRDHTKGKRNNFVPFCSVLAGVISQNSLLKNVF